MKTFKQFVKNIREEISEEEPTVVSDPISDLHAALKAVINAADIVQTAHWNLRSANFVALHPWLGETYGKLFDIADGIAEQIKIKNINNYVSISRDDTTVMVDEQILLRHVRSALIGSINSISTAATNPDMDAPTVNLLEGWQGDVEKMKWFIEASITRD